MDLKPHPIAEMFPRMDDADFAALKEDIHRRGVLVPIWVHDGKILDGQHRYRACQELGTKCPTRAWTGDSPWLEAQSLNLIRRHMPKEQVVAIRLIAAQKYPEVAAPIAAAKAEGAKKRAEGAKEGGRGHKKPSCHVTERFDSARIAGKAIGVSGPTFARVEAIAKASPEALADIAAGKKTVMQAAREVRRARMADAPELPGGKFRVFYADPPWSYGNVGLDDYGHAEAHYPSMSIQQLCDLPIKEMADNNAVLFLWVTSPLLGECWPVIKAWGFEYKTSMVWNKDAHNFGHYVSVRHEFLLICTRGSCTPDITELSPSVMTIKRSKVHSQKPTEFREVIERMYSRGRRIELFAREKHNGWTSYGNEL